MSILLRVRNIVIIARDAAARGLYLFGDFVAHHHKQS